MYSLVDAKDPRVRRAFLALILGAVGIGVAPLLVRTSGLGPITTAFYRMALAVPLLALLHEMERGRASVPPPLPAGRVRFLMALSGVFFAGDLALWHLSIHHTTVANATLLTNFAPVVVTLAAWLLFRERPTPLFGAGLALSILGAALLVGDHLRLDPARAMGDLMGLASAFFYAGYQLTIKRVRKQRSTLAVATASVTASAITLLVLSLVMEDHWVPMQAKDWAILSGLALVSQVMGQGLITYGLHHLPSGFGSVTLLVQPVVAGLLAWTLLGEVLGGLQLLGGVIVLTGILVARSGALVRGARKLQAS